MATYYHRGSKWCVLIRRKGMKTVSKTFPSKADARIWATKVEHDFDRGIVADIRKNARVTMGQLFDKYASATKDTKRNAPSERYALNLLKRHFGGLTLERFTRERVCEFRDRRIADGKSNSTVRNNLHLLSAVVKMAINDWGYELPYNPVRRVTKPKPGAGRDRRLEDDEEARLFDAAERHANPLLKPLIALALQTGMRLGELLALTWERISYDKREAFLPRTKNSDPRRVPLTLKSIEILRSIERKPGEERVFHTWKNVHSFQHLWQRFMKRTGIKGLRFHDLRHEAASRFAESGMDVMRIAAITGHRSLQMLKRYTHFRTKDLAKELDERLDEKPKKD